LRNMKSLFTLGIFGIGSHVYAQAGLNHNLSIAASCIAGVTGVYHHVQLLVG
jgi:hypothetical protein